MAYIAPPTKAPGDLLTSALWNTYIQGNADSGFARMIADYTVAGSAVANITLSSLPQTFAALLVETYLRSTSATASTDDLQVQLNGDTGANYDTVGRSNLAAQNQANLAAVVGGAATANKFASSLFLIPNYANAVNHKNIVILYGYQYGTGTGSIVSSTGYAHWRSAAAITSILLKSASGNLDIGSRVTIHGLPA